MGLSDIFKGKAPPFTSAPTLRSVSDSFSHQQDIDNSLRSKVDEATDTFDKMSRKSASYSFKRKELLRQVDEQLSSLKEDVEDSAAAHIEAKEALEEAMKKSGVSSVAMTDRPSIRFKTTTGSKKNITKKWLTSTFGDKTSAQIWSQVPTRPDSTELVISSPFDDQPSD